MGRMERITVGAPKLVAAEPMPAAVIDLRGILGSLLRRWRWIAGATGLAGLVAVAGALSMPSRYDATARVLLDPRNLQVFQNELNPGAATGDESALISESQAQVVRSTSVLTGVVRTERLDADADFGAPEPGLLSVLAARLLGPAETTPGRGETPEARAVRALDRSLSVRRTDKTFVIEIGVTTSDADKSARIANAVSEAFLRELGQSRAFVVGRASEALDARLGELRERLQRSEAAVERYRQRRDLIGAGGRLVGDQQLGDLTNQLALARTRSAEAAARLEQIQRLRRGGDLPDGTTEALQSTNLATLRTALAEARRAESETALVYGPRHPANTGMALRVRAARQQLDDELNRIARAAAADAERARSSEAILDRRIRTLKGEAATANEAQVHLRELEREAAADRGVYEAFLNRAKDLQERHTLETINARLIRLATPPLTRTGPSRAMVVLAGLVLGLLIGLAAALLREHLAGGRP
ncbi:hypothetical protein OPKNFCMD_0184 [Methylobacterium crusticola]|uniref:Lipopolysaccharide biosynthesis protein n=1 Tax=Methylobacterium crusticola TaxID=1697972 RepID=A0ABQ4QQC0_9HYPH|nr:GumC family protein [Methylobacterium crusticola]GJD47476.1 hypothetical protein OPKNFCMD_0184 [Methylobacterium crusticola]